ncbi:MAG: hypothetical protein HON47_01530 [Candidatus Diapherotrites archaeon]|jgi:uncharacterized membrane protein|uniref:DUF7343 domain-containing protein n=1 Tax=Candidatus Iainarchaeum sp. TaxID=3101447 RepID=A0A8T5GDY2_9ARCH|nr:hypothetical protein [Candidatus Diapherotrites archaeon]MBT7240976.1 hypothetical protein [Candidatus Diapherotrites archaeon]
MGKLFLILFFLVLLNVSFSATITGEVFEWYNFEKLDEVIVEINTSPIQRDISTEGVYSFEAPLGEYAIHAEYYEKGDLIYTDDQNVIITNEGNFVIDLIMFPVLDFDEEIIDFDLDDINLEEGIIEKEDKVEDYSGLIISFIVLIILLILLFLASKDMLPKTKKEKRIELRKSQNTDDLDKYARQVLELLKKRGNRLTQKEIRDVITEIGEAKISLIIAELEAIGKVKKIKKGRGNIIILKENE